MRGLFAAGFVLASMLVDATAIAPKATSPEQLQITGTVAAAPPVHHHKTAPDELITKEDVAAAIEIDLANLAQLQFMVTDLENRIAVSQVFLTMITTDDEEPPTCSGSILCHIKSFLNRVIGLGRHGHPGRGGGCHGRPNRTHGNHTHGNHTFPRPPWWRPHPHPGKGNHSHPHHPPFFCRPFHPHPGHGNHTHGNHTHPPHHGPPQHGGPPHGASSGVGICSCPPQHHGPPLPVKILVLGTLFTALLAVLRRRCHARMGFEGMTWRERKAMWRERKAMRRARCQAKRAEMKRKLAAWWSGRRGGEVEEAEEGLLEKEKVEVLEEEDMMSMSDELASFREAVVMVGEIVDVEARKGEGEKK
ncbi:hypothetical protein B0T18DRAFT_425697 [Schizothecium vesticola]|uniref:Uncharacterized protein n=1 Tax=Schizothecium vesticola TaxID=314040 RepID=A0AA40F4B5_9PEZI|nr:hypothetical protein B0T18DRAFT_425697 [Schizothecium vesticola]